MSIDLNNLPDDPAALKEILLALNAAHTAISNCFAFKKLNKTR